MLACFAPKKLCAAAFPRLRGVAFDAYAIRMASTQNKNERRSVVVSAIDGGDTIVETLYRPETAETSLVVARGDKIENVPDWKSGDTRHFPIRPENNLVKHGALLLPSDAGEYGSTEELTAEIAAYIRRYVSLSDEAVNLSAAYVFLSWVYDTFNEVPYLRFRGDYGTGKTRALMVVGSLTYKAFFASGASSISAIFRTLDTFKGTLIFDEADFRFSDEKAELVKILNNGNVKGFPVLRTHVSQKKEFDPRAFAIFGPKIVGMRRSYEDRALESRFLTIEMEPGHPHGVPINLPDAQKDEALALRSKLLMYRLRNRLSIELDPRQADPRLEPRMKQVLLPLLSVAPNEEVRKSIRDMARALHAGILSERSASIEGQVVSVLARLMEEEAAPSVSQITRFFIEAYGAEYERPITNRWIGGILRRLGIALYKSNGHVVLVPGQAERIAALMGRYGVEAQL